ncbi:MAG: ABC transporter permease subunit [Verrucomicrobia bacterium]|nr:ABC transporter permease subunit [Verrucomicrobiota bacterium]
MNWSLLQNSLLVAGLTTLFATMLGFTAALCVSGLSKPWRNCISVLAVVSLVLPPFLVTNCWLHFLGMTGAWKSWFPLNIFSLGGTVWILSLMFWPVAMFFTLAAWRKLEQSQLEADPLLRGTSLVRWLLFPSANHELRLAAVLIFILAFNNFSVPAILQVKVLPAELWVSFNTTFDYTSALKLGWPLVVIPILLLLAVRTSDVHWPRRSRSIGPNIVRRQLGSGIVILAGIVSAFALFFAVILPFSQILVSQQTWSAFLPALVAGKSAILNSFLFAAVSACAVLFFAIVLGRKSFGSIAWLSFLVPGVILGIALILIFNRSFIAAFYQSIGIVIFAFAIRYFAPAWNLTAQAFRNADRNLVDAAQMEGARGWSLFRHAYLPQIILPLCAAWYATYLFCLWDVETLVLIIPPGRETAALRIFNLLHYGHNSQVNALCLWLLVLAVTPLICGLVSFKLARTRGFFLMAFSCGAGLLVSGCSVSNGNNAGNKTPVQSKFFSHVEIIGGRGTGLGQFNKPRSLALDRDDNLFVVDMTGRVQKFSPDGAYLLHWQMPQTDLGRPKGMGLDAEGNIIVIEPHYSRVNHFSPDGKLVFQWGVHGTNNGQLAFPRSVAINSRGEMYLSEFGATERVQHFSKQGETFRNSFGSPGNQTGAFNRPEGLGLDAQDQIYVADSCNHRVQVFAPDGAFLRSFGKAGSGRSEMSYPFDVRVDGGGFQFVCEFGNSRIQIFDAANQSVEILGKPGSAPDQFANPWSIAFDSKGNLYVADSQNHRVQKFVRKGRYLAEIHPTAGKGDRRIRHPLPAEEDRGEGERLHTSSSRMDSRNVFPHPNPLPLGEGTRPSFAIR